MECELCGLVLDSERKVNVGGSTVSVCEHCTRYGKEIFTKNVAASKIGQSNYKMPDETLLVDDFGKIISQQRQKLEMTQKEFGVFLGVKLSELKMIENGKLRPDDATAKKMGNKLGLSLFE
ncbi:MAG: helix-turn-helix domain-containing protein [archaeon]|jgi:uncharacterized protein (TIGR00270 family)|nr:TIGR00270 family protein [Euryarchaeota archaeon]MDP7260854.1 helix-turn-helix domain-containing protein [archaeon]HIK01323.1 TIGR00270 family protein [Candidatus Undinarchaeales archaeon ERR594346 U_76725]|tara:strand:- start:60049 stop:60411 length:363 start_codon:yes stop_codon:yes gene_type:complete